MVVMADEEDDDFQFYRIVDKYYYILVEVGLNIHQKYLLDCG
jgi:hypothetical protein